ncbi:AAA domain-containing protein [Fusarium keratoplasticum]|uniref:AAA domain-containing protein n=1 Tax=Fusarium keratoplasticum TaxID=1328300 RepID=A0ACC0QRE4_9HYPO|nr:AAA domain-containing protein [Fusarium keratoplasticum]KAI8663179.1 AAA domain-containing protein [Fusarium keratoplasticum]
MVPAGLNPLTNDQLVLLPLQVHGFVLSTRRWATFDIDLLSDLEYVDGWNNLVIDTDIKETVLALVENHYVFQDHQSKSDAGLSSVDFIQGKGTGLIILLHGEPGVGKISTAEWVASHTKRPLFPITYGDIGDKAETGSESGKELSTSSQMGMCAAT